ncbi:hypothetical protein DU500_07665 [Haloplanus rubicundus]|uniref:Uncharacterized protein n=1 Tax=Haloplanus rubicundus TaxID=1547898 RepID=A0A345E295_9EURY|nr:hypothetical protein DU500_07665 [Haloplanus rubicundus]
MVGPIAYCLVRRTCPRAGNCRHSGRRCSRQTGTDWIGSCRREMVRRVCRARREGAISGSIMLEKRTESNLRSPSGARQVPGIRIC